MRREVRIREATHPPGLDGPPLATVKNAERVIGSRQHSWINQSPVTVNTYKVRLSDIPKRMLDE
jgi:hypothetical protein